MIGLNLSPFGGKRSFGVASTLNNGLVSAWSAEGNANDYLGLVNGTLTNGATATGTAKVGSNSFSFDGVNDSVAFASESWSASTAQTWAAWIYSNNVAPNQGVMWNNKTTDGGSGFGMWITGGKAYFRFNYLGNYIDLGTTTTLSSSTWYHIVGTKATGGVAKIYLNGTLENTGTNSSNVEFTGTQSCSIGKWDANGYFFNGNIDAVQIYNRVLSATEITELYNTGNGKQPPF